MQLDQSISPISKIIATTSMFLAAASTLIAAPPTPLTKAQLENLKHLSSPVGKKASQHRQQAQKSLAASAQSSVEATKQMQPFLERIGQGQLLAQHSATTPGTPTTAPSAPSAGKTAAIASKTEKPVTKENEESGETSIQVKFDGGLYFDGEEGLLAYLKNIRLTDGESRFKLTCSDELKVFLEKKTKEPKEKAGPNANQVKVSNEKGGKATDTKEKDKSFAAFGKPKHIIASGNVKVTGKDNKGTPFIASGNTASYNVITGEMILKGGRPTLQQTNNMYLQAQEPGLWIRIQMKEKEIQSLSTSEGKWDMKFTTKKKSL